MLENDQPIGILRRNDLVKAVAEGRREVVVTEAISAIARRCTKRPR